MYMFDLNQWYNRRYNRPIDSYMYIPVSYTNGWSVKNTIGMVVNRLVGIYGL